jgi:uncharacterized protein with PQ loop repeat
VIVKKVKQSYLLCWWCGVHLLSTQEAEAEGCKVQHQPRICSETVSKTKNKHHSLTPSCLWCSDIPSVSLFISCLHGVRILIQRLHFLFIFLSIELSRPLLMWNNLGLVMARLIFWTGSCYIAPAGLELLILLPQPPRAGVTGVCTMPGWELIYASFSQSFGEALFTLSS